MSGRRLIYLVCSGGETYRRMANLCIESLRVWGRFDGDIVVFTDGSYRAPPVGVETIEVDKLESRFEIMCSKPRFAQLIPAERYAQVAVIDADMVAVDDVNSMLCANGRTIVGMSEYPFNSMLAESCGGTLLAPEERLAAGLTSGINTGFLSMSGDHLKDNMRLWYEEITVHAASGTRWADQPYFNVLALRGQLAFRPLPRYWIDMPPMYLWSGRQFHLRACTKLLHLCGQPEESLWLMMETVRAMRSGRSRVQRQVDAAWALLPRLSRIKGAGDSRPDAPTLA
jgi:hypothetical protein